MQTTLSLFEKRKNYAALVQHAAENVESYPVGLGYVAGTLLREGHQVSFIDLAFESDPVNALFREFQEFKPQALGFTLWTSQYDEFLNILRQCNKEINGLTVVAGGPHASADSENVLRDNLVNIVVRCEGELVVPELFYALEHEGNLSHIKGIAYLDKTGNYVQTENADYMKDLDGLPQIPYDLFNVRRYRRADSWTPFGQYSEFPWVSV
jgi:radical SAM superfamily enzyme YgiQ (UPF0313 family)